MTSYIGVEQRLRTLDLLAHDAKQIEEMLARSELAQPQVARLGRSQESLPLFGSACLPPGGDMRAIFRLNSIWNVGFGGPDGRY